MFPDREIIGEKITIRETRICQCADNLYFSLYAGVFNYGEFKPSRRNCTLSNQQSFCSAAIEVTKYKRKLKKLLCKVKKKQIAYGNMLNNYSVKGSIWQHVI